MRWRSERGAGSSGGLKRVDGDDRVVWNCFFSISVTTVAIVRLLRSCWYKVSKYEQALIANLSSPRLPPRPDIEP